MRSARNSRCLYRTYEELKPRLNTLVIRTSFLHLFVSCLWGIETHNVATGCVLPRPRCLYRTYEELKRDIENQKISPSVDSLYRTYEELKLPSSL